MAQTSFSSASQGPRGEFVFHEHGVAHPARFDFEPSLPSIGGEREIVRGEVEPGERVVSAAVQVGDQVDLTLLVAIGPFEKHVLEEMGLPRLAQLLVA